MCAWAAFSRSARRAEALSCGPARGPWCSSARASGRRPSSRCYTLCRRRIRHDLCCGCTSHATESTFRSRPKCGVLSRTCAPAAIVCFSRPEAADRLGTDYDAAGHLTRAVFEEAGVTPDADVFLCGPTRFMTDMSAALTELGVRPDHIHLEIFNGGESLTPGVVGAVTRHRIGRRSTSKPARWCRSRAAA